MKIRPAFGLPLLWLCLLLTAAQTPPPPIVHAILLYAPTCPHCHTVMEEVLPPLREKYGAQLEIREIDTTQPAGKETYQAAMTRFNPPQKGVPALVIGDTLLMGGQEIPDRLPDLIAQHLANGGVDWPALPGLTEPETPVSWQVRFAQDPANGLAVAVLIGLCGVWIAVSRPHRWQTALAARFAPWGPVILLALGLVASAYLSYIELTHSRALCGPVGDCNAVQQSRYALLFDILPIAVIGFGGYLLLAASYLYGVWFPQRRYATLAPALTFVLNIVGLTYSIYLTYLEPFVIGATCAWCLTSAGVMGALTLLSAGPGWAAIATIGRRPAPPMSKKARRRS